MILVQTIFSWELCGQGQSDSRGFKSFSLYHNTNFKLWHIVREMKLKHFVVYENILMTSVYGIVGEGQLGKFNHLIFKITSRWLFISDMGKKVVAKDTNIISYTFRMLSEAMHN